MSEPPVCECGKEWNHKCASAAISVSSMHKIDTSKIMKLKTPSERRAAVSNPEYWVKVEVVHGLRKRKKN